MIGMVKIVVLNVIVNLENVVRKTNVHLDVLLDTGVLWIRILKPTPVIKLALWDVRKDVTFKLVNALRVNHYTKEKVVRFKNVWMVNGGKTVHFHVVRIAKTKYAKKLLVYVYNVMMDIGNVPDLIIARKHVLLIANLHMIQLNLS